MNKLLKTLKTLLQIVGQRLMDVYAYRLHKAQHNKFHALAKLDYYPWLYFEVGVKPENERQTFWQFLKSLLEGSKQKA